MDGELPPQEETCAGVSRMVVDHYSGIIFPIKLRKAFTLLIPEPSITQTFHCSTESNYRSYFSSTEVVQKTKRSVIK